MTTRRKIITKPSFIITYAISFVIVFLVLGCIGLLIYSNAETRHQDANNRFRIGSELELTEKICGYLDKERVTREDIVKAKELILSHYTDTAQYTQVLVNGEPIVDAGQTATMRYISGFGQCYMLELADNKYLKCFNAPESKKLQCEIKYSEDGMEVKQQPAVAFVCDEFYADFTNCKFIPVVYREIYETGGYGPEVKITPESKDIEGYMLVKPANVKDKGDLNDTTHGLIMGYSGTIDAGLLTQEEGMRGYRTIEIKQTPLIMPRFNAVYGTYILIGICLWEVCSLLFALIPASVKYNTDKRKYEIYEYRIKTTNAMAHDLKTPIASIIACSEILENNVDAENRELYLAKISETAAQMNNSVNNILQFSRSENSSVPLSKSEVKVEEIIHGIISDNEQKISEKGLKVDFDEKTAPTLNTDKELFRQALGNLINNAVLYSKDNTSVTIECNDDRIIIKNVMAEPVEDINKIKEPFVKGSSSRENGGTGLGLAIAENDLAMLKYKLNVKTENDLFVCMVDFK